MTLRNSLLSQTQVTWQERTSPTSIAAHRRREAMVALGAWINPASVDQVLDRVLAIYENPREQITVGVDGHVDIYSSYPFYRAGQLVTTLDSTEAEVVEDVQSVTITLDDKTGLSTETVVIKDQIQELDEEYMTAIQKMTLGIFVGSAYVGAQPAITERFIKLTPIQQDRADPPTPVYFQVSVDATGNWPFKYDIIGNATAPLGNDGTGGQFGWSTSLLGDSKVQLDNEGNPHNVFSFGYAIWMRRNAPDSGTVLRIRVEDDSWGYISNLKGDVGGFLTAEVDNQGDVVTQVQVDFDTHVPVDHSFHLVGVTVGETYGMTTGFELYPETALWVDGVKVAHSTAPVDTYTLFLDDMSGDKWRIFGGVDIVPSQEVGGIMYWKNSSVGASMASLFAQGPPAPEAGSTDPSVVALAASGAVGVIVPETV